jgi:uncharacterized protein
MSIAMPIQQDSTTGRAFDAEIDSVDRHFAVAMHLVPLANFIGFFPFALLVPLILWIIRKDQSPFADDHGREICNFTISFFILHLVLAITVIGVLLIPVLWIVAFVSLIRAAVAGSRGEYFRYPVTFRLL